MSLVNLKSDLTNLKYGSDVRGGGSSGQPFIITDPEGGVRINQEGNNLIGPILKLVGATSIPSVPNIGEKLRQSKIGTFIDATLNGDDFIRGGATGAAQASLNDTIRIARFLTQNPKGPLFIAKQVGLQLSNPRGEINTHTTGIGILDKIVFKLNRLVGVTPNRIYNLGINTLAQIPVNAFGGHIIRHGFTPLDLGSYQHAVSANNKDDRNNLKEKDNFWYNTKRTLLANVENSNRLIMLKDRFNLGDNELSDSDFGLGAREILREERKNTRQQNRATRKEIRVGNKKAAEIAKSNGTTYKKNKYPKRKKNQKPSNSKDIIDFYLGGPGSTYGIGATLIGRHSYTEDASNYANALRRAYDKLDRSENANPINWLNTLGISNKLFLTSDSMKDINGFNPEKWWQKPTHLNHYTYTNISGDLKYYGTKNSQAGISNLQEVIVEGKTGKRSYAIYQRYETLLKTKRLTVNKYQTEDKTVLTDFGIYKENEKSGITPSINTEKIASKRIGYAAAEGNEVITIKSKDWNWYGLSREGRVGSFSYSNPHLITNTNAAPKGATYAGRSDAINLTPIFTTIGNNPDYKITIGKQDFDVEDLVRFRIGAIDPLNTERVDWMLFRAYLTQFSDSTDASWSDIKYAGRADKLFVYDGFTRKIQIGFKVAALSAVEMTPMYQKLNYLMGNLMGDYGANGRYLRGPIMKMTVGNWIENQTGVLNNISYTIPQDSPWEIGLPTGNGDKFDAQKNPDKEHLVLPHVIEVSMTFTPIGSQNFSGGNALSTKSLNTSHIAQSNKGLYINNFTNSTIADTTSAALLDKSKEIDRLNQEAQDEAAQAALEAQRLKNAEEDAKMSQFQNRGNNEEFYNNIGA